MEGTRPLERSRRQGRAERSGPGSSRRKRPKMEGKAWGPVRLRKGPARGRGEGRPAPAPRLPERAAPRVSTPQGEPASCPHPCPTAHASPRDSGSLWLRVCLPSPRAHRTRLSPSVRTGPRTCPFLLWGRRALRFQQPLLPHYAAADHVRGDSPPGPQPPHVCHTRARARRTGELGAAEPAASASSCGSLALSPFHNSVCFSVDLFGPVSESALSPKTLALLPAPSRKGAAMVMGCLGVAICTQQ